MRPLAALLLASALACGGAPRPPPAPPAPRVDPAPLLAAAQAALADGDRASARSALEAAIAADPAWDLPRIALAELLLEDGVELERAGSLLAPPVREDNPRVHRARGDARALLGDDAGAEASWARALALADDPALRMRRALALDRLGRLDEAAVELEALRAADPGDLGVAARLADVYERAGRIAEAEALLASEVALASGRAAGWTRLARFYERTGQPEKARDAARRAREVEAPPGRTLRPLKPSRR